MMIIHEASDDALLTAQTYWRLFEESNPRNRLLLFDALGKLQEAERQWPAGEPMRGAWKELNRKVTAELCHLGDRLIAARSPAETERAIFDKPNFRASVDRRNALNNQAIKTAILGNSLQGAKSTLEKWGLQRTVATLQKIAYQHGLGRRRIQ